VGGLVRQGVRQFRLARLVFGHGSTNAYDEAAYLALHALGLPLDAAAGTFERRVSPLDARRALDLFQRRIRERRPAAYLTREAWLGGFRFFVDEHVVVPRSPIAELLRDHLAPWISARNSMKSALDLCTGSGCLAILLANSFPRAKISASDISRPALAVARRNVREYRLDRRVRIVESDLFARLGGKRYDLIVCNPPYVTASSMRRLPREYRYEPRAALAGGKDGLVIVRRVLDDSRRHLSPRGLLVVEVGGARKALERAYPRLPFTWLDTSGAGDVFLLTRGQLEA